MIEGQARASSPAAPGTDRLDHRRPARRRTGRPRSSSSTTSSAGAHEQPRPALLGSGTVAIVEGDIRDRAPGAPSSWTGIDLVFHQAAIRITQCAEEPRLALEVLVDGTFNVARGRGRAQASARSSPRRRRRCTAWPTRFPTTEHHHPYAQRHALRRGQDLQRGPAPQLPRDVRPRLRRPALLQRVRPADGHPRRLHRGARPVDGADRGGRAAAHPRRRHPDDGLRLHRGHRPRQPARRGSPTSPTRSSTSASGTETSLAELAARPAAGDGQPTSRRSTARRAASTRVTRRLADISRGRASARLHGRGRAWTTACGAWSTGGGAERAPTTRVPGVSCR